MARLSLFTLAPAILLGSIALAHAGPCAGQISKIEQQIKTTKGNPLVGPSAAQTVAAQLGRQPTPLSVQSARRKAAMLADEALQSARKADAAGDVAACEQALRNLRDLYGI